MGWDGPVTHRQFEAWYAWHLMEFNNPSRADYYAANTAHTVACANAEDPKKVEYSRFLLKFQEKPRGDDNTPPNAKPNPNTKLTAEDQGRLSEMIWCSAVGATVGVSHNAEANKRK